MYSEALNLSSRGNYLAAKRLLSQLVKNEPNFVNGHSLLGNTYTAVGELGLADDEYSNAIDLCLSDSNGSRCKDLWLSYVNRGCVRLNSGAVQESLSDFNRAASLRSKPELTIATNRARALEILGDFPGADSDYEVAVQLSGSEIAPFWLRSALVKYEQNDVGGAHRRLARVEQRFGEAPEVLVAKAIIDGDGVSLSKLPESQRLLFRDESYLKETLKWGPRMTTAVKALKNL